jgi:hypothetical protein
MVCHSDDNDDDDDDDDAIKKRIQNRTQMFIYGPEW